MEPLPPVQKRTLLAGMVISGWKIVFKEYHEIPKMPSFQTSLMNSDLGTGILGGRGEGKGGYCYSIDSLPFRNKCGNKIEVANYIKQTRKGD